MDILAELRKMVSEADQELPFERNNVRYMLDFQVIPGIIADDGQTFILNLLAFEELFICDLFNRYYDQMNPTYFPENPKKFEIDEFTISTREYGGRNRITYVSLPSEFDGSILICRGYAFAYEKYGMRIDNIRYFTIEQSTVGTSCIGSMSNDGIHSNYGSQGKTINETIEKIAAIAFE